MDLFAAVLPLELGAVLLFFAGTFVGRFLTKVIVRWPFGQPVRPAFTCSKCGREEPAWSRVPVLGWLGRHGRCSFCGHPLGGWRLLVELCTGALFAAYFIAAMEFQVQQTPEVLPDAFWWYGRVASHLVLLTLLIAATGTDLVDYVIPDVITVPGMLFGLAVATISGDVQIIHLWVDWHHAVPDLAGPYIPEWIREHPHWHGLAWSAAGLAFGGGATWLVRIVASAAMGREALGFGDVMLMAMIGSFLGWQPMVFVLALAPFCGLFVGLAVKLLMNRPYVPYGPFLAASAVVVLFTWRWLWMWELTAAISVRLLFGDALTLAILAAVAVVALAGLLVLLRLYRMIPGKPRDARR